MQRREQIGERVALGRKGGSPMVKIRCTDKAPDALNDIEDAQEMGAKWEGDALLTYDMEGFLEQFADYESNDYMIDND